MEINMRLAVLAFTLLLGCAPKPGELPDTSIFQPPPQQENLIAFETTNSPCMDAMIVNMMANGCENIIEADEYLDDGYSTVYFCSEHQTQSEWNTSKFHVVGYDMYEMTSYIFMDWAPFCSDIHVMMFIE
jgi:hypothetical protein